MRRSAAKSGVCESWPEKPVSSGRRDCGDSAEPSVTGNPDLGLRPPALDTPALPLAAFGLARREKHGLELGGEVVDRVRDDADCPTFERFCRHTVNEVHRGDDAAGI